LNLVPANDKTLAQLRSKRTAVKPFSKGKIILFPITDLKRVSSIP